MRRLLLSVAIAGLTACQSVPGTVHNDLTGRVLLDYIDLVQLTGVSYTAAWTSPGRPLQEGELGPVYARVKVKLVDLQEVHHQLQDGDAAFLEPNTAISQVNGYRSSFRLAAHSRGQITLYEADTSPNAKVGADLLDLAGKVAYIGINSAIDGRTELGAIRDPAVVDRLVQLVLKAPVDQASRGHAGLQYFVDFHFRDGTETTRSYWPQGSELARGIMLPATFAAAVTAAASGGPVQPTASPPSQTWRVQVGSAYAFRLHTHCGPDWRTSFDGSFWDLAAPAPVPTALDDPFQDGTMTLKAVDQAQFEYQRNAVQGSIGFRRHIDGAPLKSPTAC